MTMHTHYGFMHFFWSGIIRHPPLSTQSTWMGMVQVAILKLDLHNYKGEKASSFYETQNVCAL